MAGYLTPSWTNEAAPAVNASNLQDLSYAAEIAEHAYGVCSTAAATKAKTVTVDFSGTLSLFAGLSVRVKFSNSNTAASPTLNVNSTGAKSIVSYTGNTGITWQAGQTLQFTYDGTNWNITGFDAFTKEQSLSATTAAAIADLTGSTPSTPDAALNALAGKILVQSSIATGSYGGDGTTSKMLTFSGVPVLLIVFSGNKGLISQSSRWLNSFLWVSGQTQTPVTVPPDQGDPTFTQNANSLTWSVNNASLCMNASGTTYYYVAILM